MNYSKPYRSLSGLLFAAALFQSGGLAVAQEFRGTILGRITDPSDAGFTSANFGRIPEPRNAIYFPRSVQMALKLYF